MTELPVSELRSHLSDVISKVAYGNERVVLERRGKNLCALISMEDLATLESLEDRYLAELADKAMDEFEQSGEKLVPWSEVKKGQ